jgi:hypothetical protein
MIFPFAIKYSKRLKYKVAESDTMKIMSYIHDFIITERAKNIKIEGKELTFSSSLFSGRFGKNKLELIEKGKFILVEKNGNFFLTYEIFMHRYLIISCILALLIGIMMHEIWVGIAFIALFIVRFWIMTFFLNKSMFREITSGINNMIANESFNNAQNVEKIITS